MNTSSSATLVFLAALLLTAPLGLYGQASSCTEGKDPATIVPFLGAVTYFNIPTVTIYLTDAARNSSTIRQSELEAAASKWNVHCSAAKHIPDFKVDWAGTRPPGGQDSSNMTYRSSILIDYNNGFAPTEGEGDDRETNPARWSGVGNTITLYARCPLDDTFDLPCRGGREGGYIDWSTSGLLEDVITHELGHSLGLGHDRVGQGGTCPAGIMKPALQTEDIGHLGVLLRHCFLADAMNDETLPCNQGEPAAPGETHPCESEARPWQDPNGGPDGAGNGNAAQFCQEYPWSCSSPHPWAGGGLACDWACVTVTDFTGRSSSCSWDCYAVTSPGETTTASEARGVAPRLSVTSPAEGATVAGMITILGWAIDITGISAVTFGVDGKATPVQSFVYGVSDPGACTPPLGLARPWCRTQSGFSARLDTVPFTNGPHELQVVAFDNEGWATSVEVPIFVDNPVCADTTPPSVAVTSPTSGATVSGTVAVSASASDNVGVTSVKFLLDSAVLTTDNAAPWSIAWNTAASGGGGHSLQARAFDACGNSQTSASTSVTVVVPPDIAVYQAYDGIEIPRGGSSTIPDTTPNVAGSRRFRIANAGGQPLAISNPTSLISASCLDLSETPVSPVQASGEAFFRVRLLCPTSGTYTGTVSIASNDPDEASYSFNVSGNVVSDGPPPPAPDIAVYQDYDSIEVPQGGSSTINTTPVDQASSRRFRITNLGNADLSISNPSSLVSGTCLSLSEVPATPVLAGGNAYFRVRLYCSGPGTYNGTVSIQSNDPNEASYAFTVTGTVTP